MDDHLMRALQSVLKNAIGKRYFNLKLMNQNDKNSVSNGVQYNK